MRQTQQEMVAKETEIEKTENALITAHISRNDQYAQMKSRIKYMYENGNQQMMDYEYHIYVHKDDYEEAIHLIHKKG